jgi:hypothetical protein|tara:strand:- start:189 stop:368 length:180 start_codon:yes stop_codon:yes gene_type:complete
LITGRIRWITKAGINALDVILSLSLMVPLRKLWVLAPIAGNNGKTFHNIELKIRCGAYG